MPALEPHRLMLAEYRNGNSPVYQRIGVAVLGLNRWFTSRPCRVEDQGADPLVDAVDPVVLPVSWLS